MYRDGKDDGAWHIYDVHGINSEMHFVMGRREGEFFVRSTRTHRIVRLGAYAGDLPDGWWHWFSETGELLGSSLFVRGTGDMLIFGEEGRKRSLVRLVDGNARLEITFDVEGRQKTRRAVSGESWKP